MIPFVAIKEVDRAIFELIRKETVSRGLYPDVAVLADAAALTAAKAALRAAGKELVEVIGVGAWESKDEKGMSKIVVLHKGMGRGTLSGIGCTYFHQRLVDEVAVFDKYQYPDYSKHLNYEVRVICNTVAQERVLLDIVEKALGGYSQLNPVLDNGTFDTSRYFMLDTGNGINITKSGVIEWMIPVSARDLWLHSGKLVKAGIPRMTHVTGVIVATSVITETLKEGDAVVTMEVPK
jgi:hypothetical protein